ncbi:MAG: hypothetical protein ACI9YT_000674 [Halobacteriales archaeon]
MGRIQTIARTDRTDRTRETFRPATEASLIKKIEAGNRVGPLDGRLARKGRMKRKADPNRKDVGDGMGLTNHRPNIDGENGFGGRPDGRSSISCRNRRR